MARGFKISGAALVRVKGNVNTLIAGIQELGLTQDAIDVTYEFRHMDIQVNAWGQAPPDLQFMLAWANISMNLVHYDDTILDECIKEATGGGAAPGTMPAAGILMGGNAARFAAGNHFVGLNITSPVEGKPYRFLTAYLANNPVRVPIGTEKKVVQLNWRAIPYTTDPWNGGLASTGVSIWDSTPDA